MTTHDERMHCTSTYWLHIWFPPSWQWRYFSSCASFSPVWQLAAAWRASQAATAPTASSRFHSSRPPATGCRCAQPAALAGCCGDCWSCSSGGWASLLNAHEDVTFWCAHGTYYCISYINEMLPTFSAVHSQPLSEQSRCCKGQYS